MKFLLGTLSFLLEGKNSTQKAATFMPPGRQLARELCVPTLSTVSEGRAPSPVRVISLFL